MKGIILAGGTGSRLFPITTSINKQLLPVYDKPMIYYPLTTLLSAGIKEICIVCCEADVTNFKNLLGDGTQFGASISYTVQSNPEGLPQAFTLSEKFIGTSNVCLILGDNIFVDNGELRRAVGNFKSGSQIFGLKVKNPKDYGVAKFSTKGKLEEIVEKPASFIGDYAIPGFYIFDYKCVNKSRCLKKSLRGELEITDLINSYIQDGACTIDIFSRGTAWIDAGTLVNHSIISRYIEAFQQMHGILVGSPHEAALIRGFININILKEFINSSPKSDYIEYLSDLIPK